MTALQVIFTVTALVTLFAALMVVTRPNLVHSALFLILALFGVAVAFVLLEAPFLAVIQVLVYIGAIAILMIFAVMLTRKVTDGEGEPYNKNPLVGGVTAFFTFSLLVVMIGSWQKYWSFAPNVPASVTDNVGQLGAAFFAADGFVIPSIVASILLLGALIGAIVVAWPREN